ncbi:hypothetical protein RB595_000272 [Gaeumannomyces hyphopodioides]
MRAALECILFLFYMQADTFELPSIWNTASPAAITSPEISHFSLRPGCILHLLFPHPSYRSPKMASVEDPEKQEKVADASPAPSEVALGANDVAIIPKGALDPVYEAKARVLNRAIQDIGMGWYQWQLFIVVGFGWASDNLWPIVTSLIFTPIVFEFGPSRPPLLSLAQNIGLLAGAVFACEPEGYVANTSAATAVKRHLIERLDSSKVKVLFSSPRLALSTGLIMTIWALIGLAYPLYNAFIPFIQQTRGTDFGDGSTYITYRNSLIIAVLGVPGALLGGLLVEVPRIGRKGALSVSTVLTGVFLYGSTTAVRSDALLGWNCGFNFASNVMYAVLYGYTPELFPTPQRGTGNALAATSNRIFGIMAPIVAMFADLRTSAPVYTSGALFLAAGVIVLLLPFESRGKAAL